MSEDLYTKNKHETKTAVVEIDTYYINDIPVCMSWYGCDKHKPEVCKFLSFRKFGFVPICSLLGRDCNDNPDLINRVLDECPLHIKEK